MSNAAIGNIYVANMNSETLTLSLNGLTAASGEIPGWGVAGNPYQPAMQAIPRTLNASDGPGKFFNGTNSLTISWIDGLFGAIVKIDGARFPLYQDLILFIEQNQWQLIDANGIFIASGEVAPPFANNVEMTEAQPG